MLPVYLTTILLTAATVLADKPAIAPAYVAPAAAAAAPAVDSYGAPSQDTYGAPAAPAAPAPDSYGSPKEQPISTSTGTDSYGSPQAPVVSQPAAAAPVGNQGYYYYYYPVRQNAAPHHVEETNNGGLLGGLGGLLGAILGKKILLIALGITGFLVLTALGINFSAGGRALADVTSRAMPYMTEDKLTIAADFLQSAIEAYQDL